MALRHSLESAAPWRPSPARGLQGRGALPYKNCHGRHFSPPPASEIVSGTLVPFFASSWPDTRSGLAGSFLEPGLDGAVASREPLLRVDLNEVPRGEPRWLPRGRPEEPPGSLSSRSRGTSEAKKNTSGRWGGPAFGSASRLSRRGDATGAELAPRWVSRLKWERI